LLTLGLRDGRAERLDIRVRVVLPRARRRASRGDDPEGPETEAGDKTNAHGSPLRCQVSGVPPAGANPWLVGRRRGSRCSIRGLHLLPEGALVALVDERRALCEAEVVASQDARSGAAKLRGATLEIHGLAGARERLEPRAVDAAAVADPALG